MRFDFLTVKQWIEPNSSVLDLGCGTGELLALLTNDKNIHGVGVEINDDKILQCLKNQVQVIEMDMSDALSQFQNNSFDTVVMTQSLQVVNHPHLVLDDVLRVGKQAIIAFPNFAHWSNRRYLGFKGKMPVSESLPFSWFDTPNIHFFTVADFEEYCRDQSINILNSRVLNKHNQQGWLSNFAPNFYGSMAIYLIQRN